MVSGIIMMFGLVFTKTDFIEERHFLIEENEKKE